ncbi:MAG: hypothetical protein EBS30_10285 [Planctomycetes bacterium]|nr:hypothetical protein [Planctomycetota bacterium]
MIKVTSAAAAGSRPHAVRCTSPERSLAGGLGPGLPRGKRTGQGRGQPVGPPAGTGVEARVW